MVQNVKVLKIYLLTKKYPKTFGGKEKAAYICSVNKQINFS